MRLVLLGAPGSGKGTQADLLKEKYGAAHISTGDILRRNLKEKTKLGAEAESYMNKGALVPDDLVIRMVSERLRENDVAKGFLLDGFPRTISQAEALETLLGDLKQKLDAVLLFEIDEEALVRRLSNRRTCAACGKIWNLLTMESVSSGCPSCGGELLQREDDAEAVIRHRMDVYREQTSPLVSWYDDQGLLRRIDASKSREEIFTEIEATLG